MRPSHPDRAEAVGASPPCLEETPDWFQEQFHERQERRRTHAQEARGRWDRRVRRATLGGAIAAPLLSTISLYLTWPFAALAFCVGGMAGHLIARLELSPPGGAAVYGLATSAFCIASERLGIVSGLFLFQALTWLTLTCTGALIAISVEEDRLEVLPF